MRRASVEDAEAINEWVWRDRVGRNQALEHVLAEQMNVVLIEGEGCAVFMWRGPGIFEVHLALEQRGKAALKLIREMFDYLRSEHGAKLFWAAVPIESRHVIMFARLVGWKSQGVALFSHGHCELFQSE